MWPFRELNCLTLYLLRAERVFTPLPPGLRLRIVWYVSTPFWRRCKYCLVRLVGCGTVPSGSLAPHFQSLQDRRQVFWVILYSRVIISVLE
jgi:hypothetical protein